MTSTPTSSTISEKIMSLDYLQYSPYATPIAMAAGTFTAVFGLYRATSMGIAGYGPPNNNTKKNPFKSEGEEESGEEGNNDNDNDNDEQQHQQQPVLVPFYDWYFGGYVRQRWSVSARARCVALLEGAASLALLIPAVRSPTDIRRRIPGLSALTVFYAHSVLGHAVVKDKLVFPMAATWLAGASSALIAALLFSDHDNHHHHHPDGGDGGSSSSSRSSDDVGGDSASSPSSSSLSAHESSSPALPPVESSSTTAAAASTLVEIATGGGVGGEPQTGFWIHP